MKTKPAQQDTMTDALDRIKRAMVRQGWTHGALAKEAGVSSSMLSKWTRGEVRNPRFTNLVAVATVLRLNVRLTLTRG